MDGTFVILFLLHAPKRILVTLEISLSMFLRDHFSPT
jgi:hypothetical protein